MYGLTSKAISLNQMAKKRYDQALTRSGEEA